MSRLISAVVLAGTVAGMLAACAPAAQGLPAGVSVVLVQQRSDVASREIQVRVRNASDAAITVGEVELEDARFEGAGSRAVQRESSLAAGASVDVRVRLPAVDCDSGDDAVPRVTLDLVVAGEPVRATAEVSDVLDVLSGIHARECLGERLSRIAGLAIAGFDEEPGTLRVAITPTGEAGLVRIDDVQSTPLLTFDRTGATEWRVDREIDAETAPVVIDVPLVPQRCDPHVVQEDKRGTVFTVDVEVDGVAGQVDLAAPPEMKARMLSWVAARCGFGS